MVTDKDFIGRVLHIWSHKCFTITNVGMLNEVLSNIEFISKIEWLTLFCKGTTKKGTPCMRKCLSGSLYCRIHFEVLEEDECPVCLDDYIPAIKSVCGHHVCQSCLKGMKDSGRTVCCPLCRDPRFLTNNPIF